MIGFYENYGNIAGRWKLEVEEKNAVELLRDIRGLRLIKKNRRF